MHIETLKAKYHELFPSSAPPICAAAPGRVNLLGEHTDYNDGFVFPMAIDPHILYVGGGNGTSRVRLYSLDFSQLDEFELGHITFSHDHSWANYIRGVCSDHEASTLFKEWTWSCRDIPQVACPHLRMGVSAAS